MSNVTLRIAGTSFTVACDDGEQAHVLKLGRMIDEKVSSLPNAAGQSDARSLLFAALLLADEVDELRKAPAASAPSTTSESAPALPFGSPASDMPPRIVIAPQLEALAERLENLANHLEGMRANA